LGTIPNNGVKLGAAVKTSTGSPYILATSGGLVAGQWTFAAMVYNGSTLKVYQNAVEVGSTAATGTLLADATISARIGANPDNTGYFDGVIDEVAIFNKALTPAQLQQLYRTGRGLVGHWKLDEVAGTTAADASPYNNTATLYSGLSFTTNSVTGAYNRALSLNGAGQYASAANSASLQLTDALTIAGWVKADAWGVGSDVDVIARKGDAGPVNYQLAIADGHAALFLDESDTAGVRGATALAAGRWYHVAATWDGSQVKIYVNGALDNSPVARTGTIGIDTRSLVLGGRSGANYFDGALDDVRIYNYALDVGDIKRLYGLMGRWKFDETSGTVAADSSGNGNNAILYGNAAWTTGKNGGGIYFDGNGDYATTIRSFTPPAETSVVFWMKPVGTPPTVQRPWGLSTSWELRHHDTGFLQFDVNAVDGPFTTRAVATANRWYRVVAVFSSANDSYAIYIDGKLHSSGAFTVSVQSGDFLSFGVRTGATEHWQGALDDFQVFDRLLTAEEIEDFGGNAGLRIVKWEETP
jgi:hypothetical protein